MDKVLAVGNTLGEGFSVSDGMINQIKIDDNDVRYMIRHDAAIAPGNSGGALYKGEEVIGINVMIRFPHEIYYAIPINLAIPLLAYERTLLLRDIFPTNPELISQKSRQLFARNGQVPAAAQNNPGIWTLTSRFNPLEDLIIFLQAQQGRDLALSVMDSQGELKGYGDLRDMDYDLILISSENYQDVYINVLNYDNTPANFALKVYKIIW